MKNKYFSFMGILVITLVFGMTVVGCVSLTPEEKEARRVEREMQAAAIAAEREAQEARRIAEGRGGIIVIQFEFLSGQGAAYSIHPKNSVHGSREPWNRPSQSYGTSGGTRQYTAQQDGEYVIAYRFTYSHTDPRHRDDRTDINAWRERTVYMSGNNTVRINIPW